MFLANTWEDYEVLDTGDGEKLERWGNVILRRPDPQTIWPKADPQLWRKAQAHYHRSEKGGGEWEFLTRLPERWTIRHQDLTFYVRPTSFKHTGLFPEQAANWVWMQELIRNSGNTKGKFKPRKFLLQSQYAELLEMYSRSADNRFTFKTQCI